MDVAVVTGKQSDFHPWDGDSEHYGVEPEMSKLRCGTQIVYMPEHAGNDLSHTDNQFGFVVSLQDRWSAYCMFWLEPGLTLRTTYPELVPLDRIFIRHLVTQQLVNEVLEVYTTRVISCDPQPLKQILFQRRREMESDSMFKQIKVQPKFPLGTRVMDFISGFEGIAVARTVWLYGCTRVGVASTALNDKGQVREIEWFDEQQLEVMNGPPVLTEDECERYGYAAPGGPRPDETG